ncbi:MAG: integrase [Candidatus Paceibacterota bacterium]
MDNILLFKPKKELDALANLEGFISLCKNKLNIFGKDLVFSDNIWDVTKESNRKGHGNRKWQIYFYIFESTNKKDKTPIPSPFNEFSKSYMRYMHGLHPIVNIPHRLATLKVTELALREIHGTSNPIHIDESVLNRSAQIIVDHYSKSIAYLMGNMLNLQSKFLSDNRLTILPIQWKCSIKRPVSTPKVGKKFDERRASKIPSETSLNALAKIYNIATEPSDIWTTSIVAILCSAPDRINEVLLLPENCEVKQNSKNGKEVYGLRWWTSKGADPMIKWIIPSMVNVVQEAIAKIRSITNEARKVAKWYEEHPDQIYLSKELEHLRDKEKLDMKDVGKILFDNPNKNVGHDFIRGKIHFLSSSKKKKYVYFSEFEKLILTFLPINFPYLNIEKNIKYSDVLSIFRKNELSTKQRTLKSVIYPPNINDINSRLGSRKTLSMFNRLGFTELDGKPIKLTTHLFRHWLNTLAQSGGMSQLDIAKWSGRKNIHQNTVYDHTTADQMLKIIRNAVGDENTMFGPLAKLPEKTLIPRDEFARLRIPTAHTTEFGYCVHDYTMIPCQVHLDCLNCTEHFCIKGDVKRMQNLRNRLSEAKNLLADAQKAVEDGYYGADRWMDHHSDHVERLSQLASIFDNPDIPDGAVIQLSNLKTPSPIKQAIEHRMGIAEQKSISSNTLSDADQDLLKDLLL